MVNQPNHHNKTSDLNLSKEREKKIKITKERKKVRKKDKESMTQAQYLYKI